jgi:hypothetical protein
MKEFRDFDFELKALDERARQLKARKLQQLGELVVATGADGLPMDILAGALISAAAVKDAVMKEGWRAAGATFFQQKNRKQGGGSSTAGGASAGGGGTLPLNGGAGAQ